MCLLHQFKSQHGNSRCGSAVINLMVSTRTQVRSLALLGGLRTQHCHELWCRSQTQLRSGVAVAAALIHSLAWELPMPQVQP